MTAEEKFFGVALNVRPQDYYKNQTPRNWNSWSQWKPIFTFKHLEQFSRGMKNVLHLWQCLKLQMKWQDYKCWCCLVF